MSSPASTNLSKPLLSHLLQESLIFRDRCKTAGYISTLSETSPINRIPGWSTSFYGLLGGSGALTGVGTGEDEKGEEVADVSIDVTALNQVKILREAIEAVEVLSVLLEESGDAWLAGAR